MLQLCHITTASLHLLAFLLQVGYKMRLFGDDAEAASQTLHIFAYQDRNFLTAGARRLGYA